MSPRGPIPRLHVVTDDRILARPDFLDVAAAILEAGGSRIAFHVRGPGTTGRRVFDAAKALAGTTEGGDPGPNLVVNDRVDVALAVRAAGVHLGGRSLPPGRTRSLVGPGTWIGVSVHDPAEAERACRGGADYLFAGTVYRSASHRARTPLGPDGLAAIVEGAEDRSTLPGPVPTLAIGGLSPGRVGDAIVAGAYGVAVIRGVWNADDPGVAVESFLKVLDREHSKERGRAPRREGSSGRVRGSEGARHNERERK